MVPAVAVAVEAAGEAAVAAAVEVRLRSLFS
jgi:hypothetical protein